MRSFATLLHRWAGLATAAFLFITGLTGAIISWDHELDELLNPHLTQVSSQGPALDPLELARQVEARDPRAVVTYVPLAPEPGESLELGVTGRVDPATGKLFELGYNQDFVDPVTGTELGKRDWGAVWPVTSENLVSFLYVLHYSLHIPEFWGIDHWGLWLLGIVAIVWTLDCFVGFYLTLPARRRQAAAKAGRAAGGASWWQRWKPAWKVRWNGGSYKLNFDLHRAFSLWTWILLLVLAFTAFSLNLYREVFFPMMQMVTEVTPAPSTSARKPRRTNPSSRAWGSPRPSPSPGPKPPVVVGRSQWAACSMPATTASTASASITRAATMATPVWARRRSTSTARTAACWATASPGRAPPATSSCKPSCPCIRGASSACRDAFWSPPWVW